MPQSCLLGVSAAEDELRMFLAHYTKSRATGEISVRLHWKDGDLLSVVVQGRSFRVPLPKPLTVVK